MSVCDTCRFNKNLDSLTPCACDTCMAVEHELFQPPFYTRPISLRELTAQDMQSLDNLMAGDL